MGVSLDIGQYYIVVDGYGGAEGNYEISVNESNSTCETEIIWEYSLPEEYFGFASGNVQKLDNENINLELEISLHDILLKKQRKIKLSRKIDTETIINSIILNSSLIKVTKIFLKLNSGF